MGESRQEFFSVKVAHFGRRCRTMYESELPALGYIHNWMSFSISHSLGRLPDSPLITRIREYHLKKLFVSLE